MIRLYKVSDTDQIVEAWRQASLIAHPFLSKGFMAQEEDNLRKLFLPRSQTWVFEQNGRVHGFMSLLEHIIGGLFVHPTFQRKGIGSTLINHAQTLHPSLELEVFEANQQGRTFYTKIGFKTISSRFDDATQQPMLKMRLG